MISSLKSTIFNKRLSLSLLTGLIISTASLYAPTLNAAPIYKVVDEKTGQVTFTDKPQNYEQQAGKQISQTSVTTGNSSSSASSGSNTDNAPNNAAGSATANAKETTTVEESTKAAKVDYQLMMTNPSEARAYRRPAQSIDISIQIKPALQAGDSVVIYLDSDEIAQGLSASIATLDILPGEHSVQAVIKNKAGQTVKQISRTIYVIQNTVTLQNNKKIAEQLLAYERLSWRQKVLLKLRQDNKQPNLPSFNEPVANQPMTLEQPAIK